MAGRRYLFTRGDRIVDAQRAWLVIDHRLDPKGSGCGFLERCSWVRRGLWCSEWNPLGHRADAEQRDSEREGRLLVAEYCCSWTLQPLSRALAQADYGVHAL